MVITGEELTLKIMKRLIEAGYPAIRAAELLGYSEEVIYYRGLPERKIRRRRIDYKHLEELEELLEGGTPVDILAHLTGIPVPSILEYLGYTGKGEEANS